MTMNDSWGYQHTDSNYKSPYILLRTFVDCLSMGGNLLLDIGPKEDGTNSGRAGCYPERVRALDEKAQGGDL